MAKPLQGREMSAVIIMSSVLLAGVRQCSWTKSCGAACGGRVVVLSAHFWQYHLFHSYLEIF